MDDFAKRMKASLQLFEELECFTNGLNGVIMYAYDKLTLECCDEDKMRCHIINCIAALNLIQTENMKEKKSWK
jgi:hypothetical protein